MNKKMIINGLLVFSIAAVLMGGCSNANPLVGKWAYHSSGSIYSNNCPNSLEFFEDDTVKAPSASGTYKNMGGNHIMITLDPAHGFNGFMPGIVYEYEIAEEILSFKGIEFYCEFTKAG